MQTKTCNQKAKILVGWQRPNFDRVTINTDSSTRGNPGKVAAGALLRDGGGRWLMGL